MNQYELVYRCEVQPF